MHIYSRQRTKMSRTPFSVVLSLLFRTPLTNVDPSHSDDFFRFLCSKNREDLRHFSHDHLDNLSDVVNGLVRDQLVLFPLIQSHNESYGESLEYTFWRIDIYLQSRRRKTFIGTEADMIQSLANFRLAKDSYEHQYRPWRPDVRQVIYSIRFSPVLT